MDGGAWWAAVHGVAKSRTRLSDFTFTFHFHALEKEMATHSRVLAWRIPGTGEPGGLLSMGSHRVGHDWSDLAAAAAWLKDPVPPSCFLKLKKKKKKFFFSVFSILDPCNLDLSPSCLLGFSSNVIQINSSESSLLPSDTFYKTAWLCFLQSNSYFLGFYNSFNVCLLPGSHILHTSVMRTGTLLFLAPANP